MVRRWSIEVVTAVASSVRGPLGDAASVRYGPAVHPSRIARSLSSSDSLIGITSSALPASTLYTWPICRLDSLALEERLYTFTMAPKKNAAAAAAVPAPSQVPPSTAKPAHGQTSASSQPTKPIAASTKATSTKSAIRNSNDAQEIALAAWDRYVQDTPQRVKLIDVFMAFLIVVGALQFLYCIIGGNYVRLLTLYHTHNPADARHSPSMLSSPVLLLPSANSSLLPA